MPFGGPLCASKHVIRSLNDALRMEFEPWGTECVLVEPGSIHTAGVDKVEADAERVLDARRPRARYPAGKGARIMGMMARLLPQRLLDRLRLRVLGLPGAPVAADT